ncbi:SDR family NAD(P)-dependent oxidoreductase [Edaphobacter albus]|uniref:SDR family NAD(P)-dependent oxidoreductase n=1 Tax=Edaphobacter sp. 4G125 TaxID=2763071 RepID=UPI0016487013|nr:SDR family NAD(P)-dependent oxidoreductase [Edaphobacter sp. 4G125]QNI35927.1 SDR family NAD(P)-dependent oxidoreductase [Edaphobacter sp. 4G125]
MQISHASKVVLVTGGTGGLGRSVVLAFAAENAKVTTTYRNAAELTALKQAAGEKAGFIEGVQADATDESAISALVSSILSKHGRLDVVVNTVGGYAGGIKLWELEPKVFERMLDLNLRVGFVLGRTTIPALVQQGRGVLINVAAKAAFDHAAGASAYAASKAAAVALMDCLAADVKGTGVRVNSILPSIIDTEANRKGMPDADFDRWPKPEEIARVILFLASDEARVVHGASVPVYGES